MQNKSRTIPFFRRKIKTNGAPAPAVLAAKSQQSEGKPKPMSVDFGKLIQDVPAEMTAVKTFVNGVETLVKDAKSKGFTSITISDIEALVPEGETVVQDGEKVAEDLGAKL